MANPPLALIVGGNRGIGLGVVKEMRSRGWSVIATARHPDQAEALREPDVEVLPLDMAEPEQLDALARSMGGRKLDAVLINAGIAGPGHMSASEATEAEIGHLMFVNAIAPIRLARALVSSVRERTGVLAFTSSAMGGIALNSGGHELYRASKAALNSLSRGLWSEVRGRGITLLNLHPGWVRTDMGGPSAPVSVEQSAKGLVSVIESERGKHRHVFIDYRGQEVAW
jgi:NAD(P)-dependent dehydrogenase (short-subunit alcohol dehydrogenase family)